MRGTSTIGWSGRSGPGASKLERAAWAATAIFAVGAAAGCGWSLLAAGLMAAAQVAVIALRPRATVA